MADRRAKTPRDAALDELAIAIAEATIDSWLEGELAADGPENRNDKGCRNDSADKTKAPAKRGQRATATKGLPNVRRSRR
jgi:hypothetical protein